MSLIAQGSFGCVYRNGNRAYKEFSNAVPNYFASRVLPALQPFILAAECVMENNTLHMPLWGPTLWDAAKSGPIATELQIELQRCLMEQLNLCVGLGFVHTDIKPANVAFTGAWPYTGIVPSQFNTKCDRMLADARCFLLSGAGFVAIDLDAVCPLNDLTESPRGTYCPYGPLLEPLVKTPALATYAMWFAAAYTVAGVVPVGQIHNRAEFVGQHDLVVHTGFLPPLADVLGELDRVGYFDALSLILTVPAEPSSP